MVLSLAAKVGDIDYCSRVVVFHRTQPRGPCLESEYKR